MEEIQQIAASDLKSGAAIVIYLPKPTGAAPATATTAATPATTATSPTTAATATAIAKSAASTPDITATHSESSLLKRFNI